MIENKARGGRASGFALLLTLLLVNGAAMWGQAGWALSNIAPTIIPIEWTYAAQFSIALAIGFAVAIEGVGVFLALSADEADEAGLPSGGVRLASFAVGLFVSGGLNLSHWGVGAAGFAFAFLSAISPFLWGVRARIRRGRSIAPSRRFWHPIRSIKLIRTMAWEGITSEDEGIAFMSGRKPLIAEAQIETHAEELEPIEEPTPAPAIESTPRAPRTSRRTGQADERSAIAASALLAGATPAEAAQKSGLSVQAVRKYRQAIEAVRADPHAPITLSVNAAVVDMIRDEIRRSAV